MQCLDKGDKGVNDVVCPPEGGPAKAGRHAASSLPLLVNAHLGQSQPQIDAVGASTLEKATWGRG